MNEKNKKIYVVVSQTGTILSRLLKMITHAEYNHASISFSDSLEPMYSFGRRNPYNPVWGGFVRESVQYGTFKRFKNTVAVVLAIDVDEETHHRMEVDVERMYRHKRYFHYNYMGLYAALFGVEVSKKHQFYCSEFVKYVLLKHKIVEKDDLQGITKPIDFLGLPNAQEVYRGKLKNYRAPF